MKFFYFIIFLGLLFKFGEAQEYTLKVQIGYNSFNMNDLQKLNSNFEDQIQEQGIQVLKVEDYPDFYFYHIELIKNLNQKFAIGIFFNYTSTGGRVQYQDYSGEVRIDQLAMATSFGLIMERALYVNNFSFVGLIRGSYIHTNFEIEDYFAIGNQSESQILKFKSGSIGIEPGLAWKYLFHNFEIGLELSYRATLPGNLRLNTHKDAYLMLNGEKIKAQWDGGKIGIVFGIRI